MPEYAEVRFQPSGSGLVADGHQDPRPGPRDHRSSKSCTRSSASIRDEVHFIDGDTDRVAFGMGSNGSRSMVTGGTALTIAADKVIEKGKKLAAHMMEAARRRHRVRRRRVHRRRHRPQLTLKQVAMRLVPAGAAAERHGARPDRDTRPTRRSRRPIPTAATSARSRSIPETGEVELSPISWSTMSAR